MNLTSKEAVWVHRVMPEAGITKDTLVKILSNNQFSIHWAMGERGSSARAKNIYVKFHFIRNLIKEGSTIVIYVPSE